jgi:hypothetical protein
MSGGYLKHRFILPEAEWKYLGQEAVTASLLLASSNIAILPLVSPMYVLSQKAKEEAEDEEE